MKKKILSFALCLTMVATSFTAFPAVTNAAEAEGVTQDTVVTEEQAVSEDKAATDNAGENQEPAAAPVIENEKAVPAQAADNKAAADKKAETDKPAEPAVLPDGETDETVNVTAPETVNFTEAGPFMDPVFVGQMRARMFSAAPADNPDPDGNGLALSKKSVKQADGSYKITMDAYTTGKVTSSEKSVPVDVTLVLDQSGSMNYNFAGEGSSQERQRAMKTAVNNFITSVGNKYDENTADHRISLVEFRSGAQVLKSWTKANAKGVSSLKSKVSSLNADGATNVGAGMQEAETLMGTKYNYTGSNTERQKVVIVFTDGVPTTSNEFHTGVANTAIKAAKNLKDSGCTVYSVGIFNGANPEQTYGDKGFKHNSDGTVGSKWYDQQFLIFGGIGAIDVPAGNRFLNYMSSNYKDATEIGLKKYEKGFIVNDSGWEITKNFNRTDTGYYLSANNAADLDKIFQTIVENIQTANIDLGPATKVKDMVTPYFDMPANTSDIKVYTADYNGSAFGERVPATGVKVLMNGNTVTVTGFDYNKNYVTENAKSDGTFGKKLIIEFSVTAKDQFLGGNRVPTNTDASGVYDKTGSVVENFRVPRVDVPLKSYKAVAGDINIYLNGEATAADIEGNSGVKFFTNREFGELQAWQKAYVDFKGTVKGNVQNAKEDSTYEITGQLVPKFAGEVKDGPVVKATGKINVFKPEVTFADLNGYYGDTFPDLNTAEKNLEWKHGNTKSTEVKMTKEKPVIRFGYSYPSEAKSGTYINTTKDIPVNAVAKIGKEDVSGYTSFIHKACDPQCGFTPSEKAKFLVHVKAFTLEVSKDVSGGNKDNQDFIMSIKGTTNLGNRNFEVALKDGGKVLLTNLPKGTYTVTEDSDWAWRYTPSYSPSKVQELSAANTDGKIKVTNTYRNDNWLNRFTSVENIFNALAGSQTEPITE